jgi:hypothetical protein
MFVHVKVCTWQRKYPMGVLMEYQRVAVSPSSWDVRAQLVNTAFFVLSLSNCMHFGEMRRQNEGDRVDDLGDFTQKMELLGLVYTKARCLGLRSPKISYFDPGM